MILYKLEISGFRGVKNKLQVTFTPGFSVICGRNGSGKSTICDAIEYVLSGSIIDKADFKEKRESITDYLWWRGDDKSKESYVSLTFINENKEQFNIRRDINGRLSSKSEEIEELLCIKDLSPPNCIEHLCRTSIIRDETILKFSMDLLEEERFEFARSAIGGINISNFEDNLNQIIKDIDKEIKEHQGKYEESRSKISELISEISEIKVGAIDYDEIKKSEKELANLLNQPNLAGGDLLKIANNSIVDMRLYLKELSNLLTEYEVLLKRNRELASEDKNKKLQESKFALSSTETNISKLNNSLAEVEQSLNKIRAEEPMVTALAELSQRGKEIGLINGRCPLCGSKINDDEYNSHLTEINNYINEKTSIIKDVIEKRNNIEKELSDITKDREELKRTIARMVEQENIIKNEIMNLLKDINKYGIKAIDDEEVLLNEIKMRMAQYKSDISKIEEYVNKIEESYSYEKLLDLEKQLKYIRYTSDEYEKNIKDKNIIRNKLKEDYDFVRRYSREFIDEKLSEISPLLKELYVRLKPHIDWYDIKYNLRGDVRRLLSLSVGNNINPRFIFSSGQRRILGLVFLLTIHLARSWGIVPFLVEIQTTVI